MTQHATKANPDKPKPTCHHSKKLSHNRNEGGQLKKEKDPNDGNRNSAGNSINSKNNAKTNSNLNHSKNANNINDSNTNKQTLTEKQKPSTHFARPISTEKYYSEPMQQIDRLFGIQDRWKRIKINNTAHKAKQTEVSRLRPKLIITS